MLKRRGHRDLVRSFYNFHADSDVLFSTPLERFNILQAFHPAHIPSVQWSCLAGIRSGLPPARCGDEAHRLVDHERSTLQFSPCWDLCVFWVWWFLEWATRTIWSWLLPGHLPVVEQEPLFGTICFMSVRQSLQNLCRFQLCVRMLPSFWQNIFTRSQMQICFSSLRTLVRLETQALVDASFCFPDCFFFIPCWSALIAFSFSSWFLTFSHRITS